MTSRQHRSSRVFPAIRCGLAALGFSLLLQANGLAGGSWQRDYETGLEAANKGDWDVAAKAFESAIHKTDSLGITFPFKLPMTTPIPAEDVPALAALPLNLAAAYSNQAQARLVLGQDRPSDSLAQRVLGLLRGSQGFSAAAVTLSRLGNAYHLRGRYEMAETIHRRALAICESITDPGGGAMAGAQIELADDYRAQKKYVEAEPLYEAALELTRRGAKKQQALYAHCLLKLIALEGFLEKATAMDTLKQVLLRFHETSSKVPYTPVADSVLASYIDSLRAQGQPRRADSVAVRLESLRKRLEAEKPKKK
jgi:tetratricopeptide (TPR) repeat protein